MTLHNPVSSTFSFTRYAWLITLPGLLFGYNLIQIIDYQHFQDFYLFNNANENVIIGTFFLGLLFGIFIAGYATRSIGRKIPLSASSIFGALAFTATHFAPNFTIFLFSQLALGFVSGIFLISSHIYICEIAQPSKRTNSLMLISFVISLGCLLALFSLQYLSLKLNIVFSILLVMLTICLAIYQIMTIPESPRYLAASGAPDAALTVLNQLRHDTFSAARELAEINSTFRDELRDFDFLMMHVMTRRLLTFLCFIAFLFNLSGTNVIPYVILSSLSDELSSTTSLPGTILGYSLEITFFSVMLVSASIAMHAWALENHSRRHVILISSTVGTLALVLLTIAWSMPDSIGQNMLILSGVSLYLFFFVGANICFLSIVSIEVLPSHCRELGITTIFISDTVGLLFGLQLYEPSLDIFGYGGFLFLNALISLLLVFLMKKNLPSVYSGSLEELESQIISANSFMQLTKIKRSTLE